MSTLTQCVRCRLQLLINASQVARKGPHRTGYTLNSRWQLQGRPRGLSTGRTLRSVPQEHTPLDPPEHVTISSQALPSALSPEAAAQEARRTFGDVLPPGYLTPEEYKVYERLFGEPVPLDPTSDLHPQDPKLPTIELLREDDDGSLTGVPYESEDPDEHNAQKSLEDDRTYKRLAKSKKGKFFVLATKPELDAAILQPAMSRSEEALLPDLTHEWEAMHDAGRRMYLDDIRYIKLERHLRQADQAAEADELLQFLYLRYRSTTQKAPTPVEQDTRPDEYEQDDSDPASRTHPHTQANRFSPFPTTLQFSKTTFTDPVAATFADVPFPQLTQAAHKIFGGQKIPFSASTPASQKGKEQEPIPLSAFQPEMGNMQASAYIATVYPGVYASVISTLTETRKRMGQDWLRNLLRKPGGPLILDAGGAGAGILAVREVLRAEWESMHDTSDQDDAPLDIALAGGQTGGAPTEVPYGKATVVVGSDNLRHRISSLLNNTAFVPRLPDYVHAADQSAMQRGKFDIVVAPHTLWPIEEEYARRQHLSKLWSLLNSDGGVLILVEKGVPKAFDVVASARQFLLDKRVLNPDEHVDDSAIESAEGIRKEPGMIIAPCTNHASCPMQRRHGVKKGKRTTCHFEQRYTRPQFLQRLIGARDKNFEDIKFSYLSVMRGRDLRRENHEVVQGEVATLRAFSGYEHSETEPDIGNTELDLDSRARQADIEEAFDPTAPALSDDSGPATFSSAPHSLNLPRAVLPPLKRTGHVILDLCTPAGKLERWTVPKSFSKQAYRDARKSTWGDLWALGAKTRVNKDNSPVSTIGKLGEVKLGAVKSGESRKGSTAGRRDGDGRKAGRGRAAK